MNPRILLLLIFGVSLGCQRTEPVDPEFPAYYVIDGDSSWIRDDRSLLNISYQDFFRRSVAVIGDTVLPYRKLNWGDINREIDLSVLKSPINANKPFRMVTFAHEVGGGQRDFGLFHEGIETSYPSLLARQMGVKYTLPLFEKEDYNGSGRLVQSSDNPTGGPAKKYKRVVNNLGINMLTDAYGSNYIEFKPVVDEADVYYGQVKTDHLQIAVNNKYKSLNTVGDKLKVGDGFDFFILEAYKNQFGDVISRHSLEGLSHRDWNRYPEYGFDWTGGGMAGFFHNNLDNLVRWFKDYGVTKGVIINVKFSDHVATKKNRKEDVLRMLEDNGALGDIASNKNTSIATLYKAVNFPDVWIDGTDRTIDSLLGHKVPLAFKPKLGLGTYSDKYIPLFSISSRKNYEHQMRQVVKNVNASLQLYSNYLQVPIFDLNGLLEKIHAGNYVTHDGVSVTVDYDAGNFYSSDGTMPSAFGNAVITNELILTINAFYGTQIPSVATRPFLNFK